MMKTKTCTLKLPNDNIFGGGVTFKALSAAVLAGTVIVGAPQVNAADLDLSNKPLTSPTLDYIKDNNMDIPQVKYDQDGNFVETDAVKSPGSAYSVTAGSESDYDFSYQTSDADGNLTTHYAKIDLKELPDYSKPDGYTTTNERIDNTLDASNTNKVIFENISSTNNGGAIYNTLDKSDVNIVADFINNAVKVTSHLYGGAIYNSGSIGNITGDFIGNVATSGGSAIFNTGTIGNITGDFIGNVAKSGGSAIYNTGTIGNVTGDFISNKSARAFENSSSVSNIYGSFINNEFGGLYNQGTISSIQGNFIQNQTEYRGGGFNNSGSIKLVQGDFINNYARIFGGGLYNASNGKIDRIKGNFIGNYIDNYPYGSGAAIQNGAHHTTGYIGIVEGDFIGNHVDVKKENRPDQNEAVYYAQGGAIFNETRSNIDKIKGNFIDNRVTSNGYADGGAIHNSLGSTIGEIEGSFIRNYVDVYDDSEYYSQGGAIQNLAQGKIGKITGDFIANYSKGAIASSGGAIFNSKSAEIGYIKGNFVNNSAEAIEQGNYSQGGAIYNSSSAILRTIEGNFQRNYVCGTNTSGGGAIYNNDAVIEKVTGDFKNNYASGKSYVAGGAIYNYYGKANELNGSFINNYAKSESGSAKGGAIFSLGTTTLVADAGKTNIIAGNYVEDRNGKRDEAVYVSTGEAFVANKNELVKVDGSGFGFYNKYSDYNPEKDKLPAVVDSAFSIVAKNKGTWVINDKINGDANAGVIDYKITNYYANWNGSQRVYVDLDDNFLVRYEASTTTDGDTKTTNINYKNEAGDIIAKEVLVEVTGEEPVFTYYDVEGNEISELPFSKTYNISGKMEYNVNFDGDNSGKIYLNNNIIGGANVTLSNTNLHLGRENFLDGNKLTLNSGLIGMINNRVGISNPYSLTVKGDTTFIGDVDLKNKVMDRFVTDNYGEHTGNLNVAGLNLLSDAIADERVTAVYFAEPGLKNNVINGLATLPDGNQTKVYTPIYQYTVAYDNINQYDGKGDGGYFLFMRGNQIGGGTPSNPSDDFNPAVLTAPVSTVAASQAGMTEAFKYVFEHLDSFTQLPAADRLSRVNANKYALVEEASLYNGLSTDFNGNKGSFNYDKSNKAYWFRPYVTFETMDLKNGPKVDMITYGSLIGYDGDFIPMKHGWHRIGTTYLGYNGAQIKYNGADTMTNGGLLGMTETYYKGNFWSALTLSAGASVGETKTMYGKEDYVTLLAGAASKTGYNFEFKEGKYILQPIMYLSYTFANTFDFTNAAGVRIDNKPAHSIQLHPMIRGVANCKNGWQPYAQVGIVWNALNKSNITANGIRMPEMSMKPYIEYGLGVQRNWDEKYTAFFQAMVRNGGRKGVALTLGFRWALDKDKDKDKDKVHNVSPQRKVVKQLSEQQKIAHGLKSRNTTRTTSSAILKHL